MGVQPPTWLDLNRGGINDHNHTLSRRANSKLKTQKNSFSLFVNNFGLCCSSLYWKPQPFYFWVMKLTG